MALYNLNNAYDRQRFKAACDSMAEKGYCVELKRKNTRRSLAQNSYLHCLLGYFGSEFGLSLEEVKFDIFKKTCNLDIFQRERVNKRGQTIKYIRSSADLDTAEMTTAIERFRNYSSAECGLYLPAPYEGEMLFFAQQQIEANKEFI